MKRIISYFTVMLFCLSISAIAPKTTAATIVHLTKADFLKKVHNFDSSKKWKYLGNKPAIIDFYADWCGPCRKLSPLLSDVAAKRSDVVVYKVNVDEQPELADYFKVSNIPMVVYVPMTGTPQNVIGLQSKEEIDQNIATILFKKKK